MENANPKTGRYYQIVIAGHLDETRLAEFRGMFVSLLPAGQTLVSGRIVDQAALFGLLIRIRDMGVSLISVTSSEQA